MREVDFLPNWYQGVRRQRRMLRVQTFVSGVVVLAGLIGILVSYRQCRAAEEKLALTNQQAEQAVKEVRQLDEMLSLQQQLVSKRRIVSELGLPVELSRVISELNDCLPREASFTEVEFKTNTTTLDTIADRAKQGAKSVSRRLELNLKGIAPTESEVTAFWSRLIQRPFFNEVRLVNSVERRNGDHRWRSYEITLAIPLDHTGQ